MDSEGRKLRVLGPTAAAASCLCLALSWLFMLPLYGPTNAVAYLLCFGLGLGCMHAAAPIISSSYVVPWYGLVALVSVGVVLPLPWSAGGWLLVFASGIQLLKGPTRIGATLWMSGSVLLIQACLVMPMALTSAFLGSFGPPEWICALIRAFSHLNIYRSGESTWILQDGHSKRLLLTVDSLALLPAVLSLFPVAVLGIAEWRTKATLVAGTLAFLCLRYCVLIALAASEMVAYSRLLAAEAIAISFIPVAAVLGVVHMRRERHDFDQSQVRRDLPSATGMALGAGAAFLLTIGFCFPDFGASKGGKILVDDSHGPWEPGTGQLSVTEFGTDSMYNYVGMWQWLRGYYTVDIKTDGILTDSDLAGVGVVVLKTPSTPYDESEIAALERFVKQGGGLWALGDHTNVFGTSTVLNEAMSPFGLELQYNVGLLLNKNGAGNYRHRELLPCANALFGNRTSGIDFMGAAEVRATDGVPEYGVLCTSQALESLDYRDPSFFGNREITFDDEPRPYFACLAKQHGAGRVCVWGDSTIFSTFAVFEPGKCDLVLSTLAYLNRDYASSRRWRTVVFTCGSILLGLSAIFAIAKRRSSYGGLPIAIALGAHSAVVVLCVLPSSVSEPKRNGELRTTVGFDLRLSNDVLDVPTGEDSRVEQENRVTKFASLFSSVVRVPQCFPKAIEDEHDLSLVDVCVIIDPMINPSEAIIDQLYERVSQGMKLVIIPCDIDSVSPANTLLKRSGMQVCGMTAGTSVVSKAQRLGTPPLGVARPELTPFDVASLYLNTASLWSGCGPAGWLGITVLGVEGGKPIWLSDGDVPVLAVSPLGTGAVYCCTLGKQLTTAVLGDSSAAILAADPQYSHYAGLQSLWNTICGQPQVQSNSAIPSEGQGSAPVATPSDSTPAQSEGAELHAALTQSHNASPPSIAMLAERIELKRASRQDANVTDAFLFLKNANTVAFLTGYVFESPTESFIRLTGAPARGESAPLSAPAEAALVREGYEWQVPGSRLSNRIPFTEGEFKHYSIRLPHLRSPEDWSVRIEHVAPSSELESGLQNYSLDSASQVLWERERPRFMHVVQKWKSQQASESSYVISEKRLSPLSSQYLGMTEIWLDTETLQTRKLKITFRKRGDVSVASWSQLVCVFGAGDVNAMPEDKSQRDPNRRVVELTPEVTEALFRGMVLPNSGR